MVQTGIFRNRIKVVVKTFNSITISEKHAIENEIRILKYLGSHQKLLSCYGGFTTVNDNSSGTLDTTSTHIVYELASYGSLDRILMEKTIQCFPLGLVIAWLADLSDALHFLHTKGILYNNLRTENILVVERLGLKLSNFTHAQSVKDIPEIQTQVYSGTWSFSSALFANNSRASSAHYSSSSHHYSEDIMGFLKVSLEILTRQSCQSFHSTAFFDEDGERLTRLSCQYF